MAPIPPDIPGYGRSEWKHWGVEDGDCQDARQEVLIAESLVEVTFESAKMCRVKTDRWYGAFTGTYVESPGDLDVDHLVPLKNAHLSGGWRTILFAVDDATGCVVNAIFCDPEDTNSYFLLMQGLLRRRGVPLALYTDRHPVFKHKSEYQPAGTPTQFGRAMAELGVQVIFALSPQAKGRVERTAGTFQDRLITELRLAGANTVAQARAVLKQFLPRFNRRFGVPAQCPEPAFRPLRVDLPLEQVLCFKHRRRVARDNTVKYQGHTLQLLPDPKRRSYAGAVVMVLEGLNGRLSLQHDGRIIAAQEAPPSPGTLRKAEGTLPTAPIPIPGPGLSSTASASPLELLNSLAGSEDDRSAEVVDATVTELRVTKLPKKPTFLQGERWKAVQQAKLKGMSIRGMARELGIHRDTVRRYIDAESPPTRRSPTASTAASSDTIADQPSDISAEHLDGHLS